MHFIISTMIIVFSVRRLVDPLRESTEVTKSNRSITSYGEINIYILKAAGQDLTSKFDSISLGFWTLKLDRIELNCISLYLSNLSFSPYSFT